MNVRYACGLAVICAALISGHGAAGARFIGPESEWEPSAGAAPSPDLAAVLQSTYANWPRKDIVITVNVKNIGANACPKSVCQILIRNAHAPRQTLKRINKTVRALDAGDQFAFSFSIKLGLGMYEIEAVADRDNKIAEPDETNNKARMTIAGR